MATIEDVAKRSGVSVATVSRVINGTGVVSDRLSRRVREAITELDYRPNFSGRNLRLGATRTLLVICSVALDVVLDGVYAAAEELGYRVIVHYIGGNRQRKAYVDEWFYGNVDGAILYSAFHPDEELTKISRTLPVVQLCGYLQLPDASRVSIDEEGAAYDMTLLLLRRGYRRVGLATVDIGGAQETFAIQRERGYRRALADHGMACDQSLVLRCPTGFENGQELGRRFAALAQRPDCIFCVQDILAMGVVRALQDAALRVPEDIAVAGFDDLEIAGLCRPLLTTVRQPFAQMGDAAVRLLVSRLQGGGTTGRDVILPHALVERDSTKR